MKYNLDEQFIHDASPTMPEKKDSESSISPLKIFSLMSLIEKLGPDDGNDDLEKNPLEQEKTRLTSSGLKESQQTSSLKSIQPFLKAKNFFVYRFLLIFIVTLAVLSEISFLNRLNLFSVISILLTLTLAYGGISTFLAIQKKSISRGRVGIVALSFSLFGCFLLSLCNKTLQGNRNSGFFIFQGLCSFGALLITISVNQQLLK